jgi:phosphoribosyl-dephospho-CoA transferase
MVGPYAVHDLIRVDPAIAKTWSNTPEWAVLALERAPWVVVRRAYLEGAIPVGVRGANRSERFAATISPYDIRELLKPDDLVARITPRDRIETAFLAVANLASARRLTVYPTGSFAFQLASGALVTHRNSDLDLLVKGEGAGLATWQEFSASCKEFSERFGVRIDAEVSLGDGAIALYEIDNGGMLLAKTPFGPKLRPCPL